MKNIVLMIVMVTTHTVVASSTEAVFSPTPYSKMLNDKASTYYATLQTAGVDLTNQGVFRLNNGRHQLVVSGREANARLDQLVVVPVGTLPGAAGTIAINLAAGKIVVPMRRENVNGQPILIGAAGQGEAAFEFTVPADGDYVLWGKAQAANSESNSFFCRIDRKRQLIWDFPTTPRGNPSWCKIADRGIAYYSNWNFILSWAATSPESKFHRDATFRRQALQITLSSLPVIATRLVQPPQLWFLSDLEAVRCWQVDPQTSPDQKAALLKGIRPYVDNCYQMTLDGNGWRENTPNIQIQAAAILTLAAQMWQQVDPAASARWTAAAKACLDRAWKWKIPGGPFVYSYGSGVDAGYFSQDAKHLTRIWLLTAEPRVGEALRDLATAAIHTTSYGHPLSFGSPWWKHTFWQYNRNDVFMIVSQILVQSRDPQYARLLQLDQQRNLPSPLPESRDWLIPFYNSLQPEFRTPVAPFADHALFAVVENGPALRAGPLTAAMPWRSWCESTCGAAYANAADVTAVVNSVILTAISPDTAGKVARAHYPVAYSIVEMTNPRPLARAVVIGDDFIVSATSFRPALGGPALPKYVNHPNQSPWLRTDLWFVDRHGGYGVLELTAERDNPCIRVALWAHTSEKAKIADNRIDLNGLSIRLQPDTTKLVNLGKTWGYSAGFYPLTLIERRLAERGNSGFRRGETFRNQVAIAVKDQPELTAGPIDVKDGLYRLELRCAGKPRALLLFNRSSRNTRWIPERSYQTVRQSVDATGPGRSLQVDGKAIILPPGSLSVAIY